MSRPEQEKENIEAADPACLCGRCDGRGTLRITTTGAEKWVPCRDAGNGGYLPDRDRWKL